VTVRSHALILQTNSTKRTKPTDENDVARLDALAKLAVAEADLGFACSGQTDEIHASSTALTIEVHLMATVG
jgi:hypothetical protein